MFPYNRNRLLTIVVTFWDEEIVVFARKNVPREDNLFIYEAYAH